MALLAKIYDEEISPKGQPVGDQPDGFLSTAVVHARRSPERFPLLARVPEVGAAAFSVQDRDGLRAEWLMLESLAVGGKERRKWNVLFAALARRGTFKGVQFVAN